MSSCFYFHWQFSWARWRAISHKTPCSTCLYALLNLSPGVCLGFTGTFLFQLSLFSYHVYLLFSLSHFHFFLGVSDIHHCSKISFRWFIISGLNILCKDFLPRDLNFFSLSLSSHFLILMFHHTTFHFVFFRFLPSKCHIHCTFPVEQKLSWQVELQFL